MKVERFEGGVGSNLAPIPDDGKLRIVFISDTHLQHDFAVPNGDLLIHSGDATFIGNMDEIVRFNRWISELPHGQKVFVPGNHDGMFDTNEVFARSLMDNDIHVLINQSVEIYGLKIYGSPYTPQFFDWWFMYRKGAPAKACWELIPNETDILVTHGPPHGILDLTGYRSAVKKRADWTYDSDEDPHVGCPELKAAVNELRPMIHSFGHIHNDHGFKFHAWDDNRWGRYKETLFLNAAICNEKYKPRNKPFIVTLEEGEWNGKR